MARITKVIIPVAGYGTRRLPITKAIEKSMLPIGDRPLVDYAVSESIAAGIRDIYFVVNKPSTCATQIEAYYGRNAVLEEFLRDRKADEKLAKLKTAPEEVRFHYVAQDPNAQYGTAVPVALVMAAAKAGKCPAIGADECVAFANGDDFFWDGGKTSEMASFLAEVPEGEAAVIGVECKPEEATRYAVIGQQDDYMTTLTEKPELAEIGAAQIKDGKVLVNINRFVLSPGLLKEITEYVEGHDFSPLEQEYMITDPVLDFVKKGGKMRVVAAKSEWLDGGSLEGWFRANQTVLGK
ncbi:sugar phosphate nucleotidyltransferase [Candidatus Saccharibacteria bacterium]|nr:sugar phosphate nucleotidyltransferase [Candidatus Saccharibacteria bacterium]